MLRFYISVYGVLLEIPKEKSWSDLYIWLDDECSKGNYPISTLKIKEDFVKIVKHIEKINSTIVPKDICNYYQKLNHQKIDSLISFNNKDGTNNLVKIIVEFGIFGVFFYFSIFLFLINNKVSLELKLFYLPFIITQSLRGAGYFNGGFLLSICLMISLYTHSLKSKNSQK